MKAPGQERLIGTFDGSYGDWSGAKTETKVELVVRDGGVDDDTGERFVEIVQRATLPANEHEVVSRVPEYAAERYLETVKTVLTA